MHPTMYLHLHTSSVMSVCFAVCMSPFYTLLHCKCIICDIFVHYTSLLCKDVMSESHLDHLEPLHVGGTLIDCYLII